LHALVQFLKSIVISSLVARVYRSAVPLCALVAGFGTLQAQHFLFRQFGQSAGLKNLSTRCLTQTRQGFLWVGTENGLFRFDGQNFTRFSTAQGLPGNSIDAVMESSDGTLWVGTSAGVITFRNGVWQTLGQNPPVVYHPQAIAQGANGIVYLAAGTDGLLQASWAGGFWKVEPVPGVPKMLTRSVYPEGKNIWFTSGDSLWLLQDGRLKQFSTAQGLPADEDWAGIARDSAGDLYVRSHKSVRVLRTGSSAFQLVPGLPTGNWSDQLAADSAGNIAIPTDEGIRRPDGSLLAGQRNGLPDDPACCLITDREGQPWIGTVSQGVYLWEGANAWEGYSEQDGLSSHIVNAIHRDQAGTLWIGTRRSMERLSGNKIRLFTKAPWANQVRAIRSTPDGTVWVATLDDGLIAVRPETGRFQVMDLAEGFTAQRIVDLDVIGKQLWVYTRQGVFVADFPSPWGDSPGGQWHFHRWTDLEQFAPETREHSVYRVILDRQGRLWAATLAGLFMKDKGKWQRFGWRDRLLEDAVAFLTEDGQGHIWIGYSSDIGISKLAFEAGHLRIEHFTQKNYLTSNVINFLETDSRGWIWVGTDSGVDTWRPSGWRHYDTEDGLIASDTSFNAFLADNDGSVWIGTSSGLAHFNVSKETAPAIVPAVALTDVEVNGRRAEPKGLSAPLPPRATVKLLFSVLSYRERQHARFRYRLLGLDSQWIDNADGDAVFPNLGHGEYRFEVKAYHPLRGWLTEPATVSFQIAPYWWQTAWSIVSAAAALLLLIVAIWRWRVGVLVSQKNALARAVDRRTAEIREEKAIVEQQKKQIEGLLEESQRVNRLKDEFLANISHEIRTPLHGVLGMTGLALVTSLSQEQREYLELAEQSARSLFRLLNDILDFSKIQAGKLTLQKIPFSLRECVEKAAGATALMARRKGLEFKLLLADDLPQTVLGDPDRLQQILSNLTNNAAKFTEQGRIQVLVFRDALSGATDRIHFSVRDTGQGIPREKWSIVFEPFRQADGSATRKFGGTGLGLSICSRLVEQMGGQIALYSEEFVGSTFSFTISLPQVEPDVPADAPGENETALAKEPQS
jgi:signal transduction histidine kinase/ligand-binding sensor domain-containing protein